jgi:hypothetical protein
MGFEDGGNKPNSDGSGQTESFGANHDIESLQATNAKLVDTLQQLQRERAGDALEGVLGEVDRTISGMLTYVEDLRRTREKLVRGVQSVADRLAEIDRRAVLGVGSGPEQSGTEPSEHLDQNASTIAVNSVDLPDVATEASAAVGSAAGSSEALAGGIQLTGDLNNLDAGTEDHPASGDPHNVDDSIQTPEVTELVVHGCTNLGLVTRLQATLSSLDVVESLRIRQFHRETLFSTVAHYSGQFADEIAGLEVEGRRLSVIGGGEGRIEASFT